MKIVIPHQSLLGIMRWSQRFLLAGGVSLLLYCGFVVMDAWIFQRTAQRQLESLLTERRTVPSPGATLKTAKHFARHLAKDLPLTGEGALIGRLEIPRLELSVMVVQGTSRTTLGRAAGHIPGTALPGELGNVGVSAHRDTFFRPLRNIRQDDIITITTLSDQYHYRVVSTKVVNPLDVAVLAPGRGEILTLVTCYPFNFVGAAP